MSFDLNGAIAHNNSDLRSDHAGLVITTPDAQWAYAAEIPSSNVEAMLGKFRVSVSLDCTEGRVGVALLHRDGSHFVAETEVAGTGHLARLRATSLDDVKSLIIRNWSAAGPSTVIIRDIHVGMDDGTLDDMPAPTIDESKFQEFGRDITLPQRRERQLDPATATLLPPYPALIGSVLVNAYVREVLGKKTYGRILNIGAAEQSVRYRYDLRLRNSEYHTLEPSADTNPTYVSDARNMPDVPSNYYDWVLAIAVLEHVNDMHAVVAEITRVLKPGGYTYLMVPFHNELHFTSSYGDYWRVSPFGFHELLDSAFAFEEVEYWGDCIIDPLGVGVIARKGGPPARGISKLYYIDGGVETAHRYIRSDVPFSWTMPITRLNVDGLDYLIRVQDFRAKYFSETGYSMTHRQADKYMFHEVAIPDGTILVSNEESRFIRPLP